MKLIPLGKEKFAKIDEADYERLSEYKWHYRRGYAASSDKGRTVLMHRLVLGQKEGMVCDHINGDKSDNRRENLRFCTHAQNCMNYGSRSKRDIKYRGVSQITEKVLPRPWLARVFHKKKRLTLGYFHSPEMAARTYNRVAKIYFKEFAYQNVI